MGKLIFVFLVLAQSAHGNVVGVDTQNFNPANDGLDFVTPEQIQELAEAVIAHRLVMDPQARFSGRTAANVVKEVMKKILVPA